MALRILHTSDWHLGHVFHGVEREYEHRIFLDWLLDTIEAEAVDALLIAGDVFDAANPPACATKLWYSFLGRAHARAPRLQIVVIGGNHDSAARLEAPRPILNELGPLHVVGGLPRVNGDVDVERLIVPLQDRQGAIAAWVLAVPFLRPADLPAVGQDADPLVDGTRALYERILQAIHARRKPDQAVIAMGHCYMVGGQLSESSERKVLGGNQHPLPHDIFGADVTYAALGHLHVPQRIGGRENIRYSGTVLPLSFDAKAVRHSVVLVETNGTQTASIRELQVPRSVPLISVPNGAALPLEVVLETLKSLSDRGDGADEQRPLLEVCVALDKPEPALRKRIDEAMEGKEARLVRIAPPVFNGTGVGLPDSGAARLSELSVEQVFLLKYKQKHGNEPSPEMLAAFHELRDHVAQEGA
ncbi:MAG TPA: exonuclease SbcCD subunit D C-terminal domain-containing protein [Polyangia bacterium]